MNLAGAIKLQKALHGETAHRLLEEELVDGKGKDDAGHHYCNQG